MCANKSNKDAYHRMMYQAGSSVLVGIAGVPRW